MTYLMVFISHDNAFFTLPRHLQRRIDSAFNSVIERESSRTSSYSQPPLKRKKTYHENSSTNLEGGLIADDTELIVSDTGGGFLLDEQEADTGNGGGFLKGDLPVGGGGFLVEDNDDTGDRAGGADNTSEKSSKNGTEPAQIALSSIPSALQLLDLPPDDEEVLTIFRNAALGWANHDGASPNDMLAVTQNDWRAVCTILLDPAGEAGSNSPRTESPAGDSEYQDDDVQMQSDDEADSDYEPGALPTKSPRRVSGKRHTRASRLPSDELSGEDSDEYEYGSPKGSSKPRALTARQKATCREAFAMFFPDAIDSKENLDNRRIMLTDIQGVAKLLGEKLKAEEMLEMLEVFSTSPDKSMGLQDFERMMVAAKLA